MEQKTLEIKTGKISYYEANENGIQTLFFVHGNSGSSLMWSKQFCSNLKDSYRLIAIDLPGHGDSFHSSNPKVEYSPIQTAEILSQIINGLKKEKPFILIGFSYGTNVVAEMLNHGIKPAGIVLLSSCIVGKDHGLEKVFLQNESPSIFFYNEVSRSNVQSWFSVNLFGAGEKDASNLVNAYFKVSPDFKPALFKAAGEGKISDEIVLLNQSRIPVCVVFGLKDTLVNVHYLDNLPFPIWQNYIYKLANAGHWVNIDTAKECNSIIETYAQEMFKPVHV